MKLAIFGATGTVGRALLAQALDAGHQVRVLARTPAKVARSDPAVAVLAGDAKDPAAVRATVVGCDAVLSTLGGVTDPDAISVGTATIVSAMQALGLRRLVIMQGFHLDFPGDPANIGRRLVVPLLRLTGPDLIRESRSMAVAVQECGLDWTVVRAPRVTVGPSTRSYRFGRLSLGPWNTISNGDVADAMLRCLSDATSVHTAPMVAAVRRGRISGSVATAS
jgi:uncharacterized protein YbjT (DUF2867 family)